MADLNEMIHQAISDGDSIRLSQIGSEYSRKQLDDCFERHFQETGKTYFRKVIDVVKYIGEDKGVELLLTLVVIYTIKDIDLHGPYWVSAAISAVLHGYSKIVEKLVEIGSDCLNYRNYNGSTPYHTVSSRESGLACVSMIKTLFKLGCTNVDVLDDRNTPPLFTTCNLDAAELFIQLGSKMIDYQNVFGCTKLHLSNDVRMITLFVRHGATVDILNKNGQTPFAKKSSLGSYPDTDMLLALNYTVEDQQLCKQRFGFCLDEQKVLDIRYDVYFSWSLVARLLGKIEHQII